MVEKNKKHRVCFGFLFWLFAIFSVLLVTASSVSAQSYSDAPLGGIAIDDLTTCSAPIVRNISVPDSFTISDVDFGFNANHTYRGDIQVTLQHPDGTRVTVIASSNDSDDNYDLELSDGAGGAIDDGNIDNTASPFYDRIVSPSSALSAFNNKNSSGTWKVEICDTFSALDNGTYNQSRLTLTSSGNTNHNCPGGNAVLATTGTGTYRNIIYWLDWSCGSSTRFNAGDTISKSWTTPTGATINAFVSNITAALRPYNTGFWSGDKLDELYGGINPIGLANADNGADPTYSVSFSVTVNGVAVPADIIVADAEDHGNTLESSSLTTDGTSWQPLESAPASVLAAAFSNGGNTITLNDLVNTAGGTLLAISQNVSQISANQRSGGIGAIAFGIITPFDFGDAPSSYGAPSHLVRMTANGGSQPTSPTQVNSLTLATFSSSGSYLGTVGPDPESATQSNAAANGDDNNGTPPDDEEAVNSFPVLSTASGVAYTVPVNVTNSFGTSYLVGYIDFNKDGDFLDAGEKSTTVSVNSSGSKDVSFTTPAGMTQGTTYARFRIGITQSEVESPIGNANSGEVEDYQLTVDLSLDPGTSSGPCVYIHNLDGLPPLYNSAPAYSLNNPVTFNGIHTTDTFTSTGFSGINADASGSGKFLFHNTGDGVGAGGEVFGATSTVLPNTNYRLSFKLANQNTINNAQIQPFINGSSLGSAATAVGTNNWQQFDYIWSSGAATTATFSLTNIITIGLGNDFGIDEISLCALSDYGDAPDTSAGTGTGNYQTLAANGGPQHAIVSGLQIGTAPDSDSDGFANGSDANSNATDDDSEGTADEGSITFGALETGDTNYSLNSIAVTNTTGGNATLFGWIDFDQNGSFDEDERATATVINGTTTANLSWSSLPGIVSGTTYARFRLAASADLTAGSNGGVDEASLGTAASGEVEDYQLTIEVGVNGYKSVKLTNDADGNGSPTPGDTVEYTLHYVNQGTGSVSNFQINDQLPVGLTITAAGAQTVSVSGTGTTAIANLAYTGAAAGAVSDLLAASAAIGVNGVVTVTIPAKIDTGVTGSLNNQASATGTGISTSKLTDNAGQTSDLSVALQAAPFNLTIPASSESQTIAASIDPTVLTIAGAPNVGLVKSCTVPADCTTVAQIPGTELTYQIDFTNNGTLAATGLVIVDAIPDNTDFKLGSATANTGTTGLTFVIEYSSDYVAAPPGAATWTYTPVSAGGGADAGYDRLVKAIRWRVTAGSLSQTSPNNSGSVSFISKIR